MTPEEKQAELIRHRDIILATLDYLNLRYSGSFVTDGWDSTAAYYDQQKLQAGKYFQQRRLDRLQQQLRRLTEGPRASQDIQFVNYIKEMTGYEPDIFSEVRSRKETIPTKGRISTRQSEYSEIIKQTEQDGRKIITVRVSTGPKPSFLEEQEAVSPDGKRMVRVTQWRKGKHASTSVSILFETTNGPVYGTTGNHPDVRAFWKDNNTVVVETRRDYFVVVRHKEVRSFNDVVTIEYVEH
jgi:hypothetical protein